MESMGPNCPHNALMSTNKKGLHVRRSTIFPQKISDEQKKVRMRPVVLGSGVEEIIYNFYKTLLFATHLKKFLKNRRIGC